MMHEDSALLVVDVQNGFISERDELPVAGGAEIVPIINDLLPLFPVRVATQDWHPRNHGSFASRHSGRKRFERIDLDGILQTLWPDHCVQGTHGAEFAPELKQEMIQAIIRKGSDPNVYSYSAFTDNAGMNPTGLDGYLRARGVKRIYIVGLALDYCVLWSALDARRLLPEAEVCVVLDATRHVDSGTGADAVGEMEGTGVRMVRSREIMGAGRPARE